MTMSPNLSAADHKFCDEVQYIHSLIQAHGPAKSVRFAITNRAIKLVENLRVQKTPTLMESFLLRYGLSTEEGVALMELAEAMLRVPDSQTALDLIKDKVSPFDWSNDHKGPTTPLIESATSGLKLAKFATTNRTHSRLKDLVQRLGEPVVLMAVRRAMQEMGHQFVLGETMQGAIRAGTKWTRQGVSYSYDMLGEAALTQADAVRYCQRYQGAIEDAGKHATHPLLADNPSISIKLSALHPRYETAQHDRVMNELVPTVLDLAQRAKQANVGLSIDAEEQDRLALSFDVIARVMATPILKGWDGFGVVVQAYGKRAALAIERLYQLAQEHDQKVNVRLVKGAYWDSEIKHAQVEGLVDFPVLTTKPGTDVAYICLAQLLFDRSDHLYPQFATHNAHTIAAVEALAKGRSYELQRLHGMGENLHGLVKSQDQHNRRFRIYAPVGEHRELLAYLVRRLLENGANSSFVNQVMDPQVPIHQLVQDPFAHVLTTETQPGTGITKPADLFAPTRRNSVGYDLSAPETLAKCAQIDGPLPTDAKGSLGVTNPSTGETIGYVQALTPTQVSTAIDQLELWEISPPARAQILNKAADLYEAHSQALFRLLGIEAGKTAKDRVGELREAVDFLRFYAAESLSVEQPPLGIVAAISPWNFPLAIFTGQIVGALSVGNAVVAKPAPQTPLVAQLAVSLLHQAGVPKSALKLVVGEGRVVGDAITQNPKINAVLFTGSTTTAKHIVARASEHLVPGTPIVAETGGLNAMIVDSTSLPEQAIQDIVASAFQSAGQRCSALRCLYIQSDCYDAFVDMLKGAMDQLAVGPANDPRTDVGPIIDATAQARINAYLTQNKARILHQLDCPDDGFFISPTLVQVDGIQDLETEVFGPVLHVASFDADALDSVIDTINASGYGLTFGLFSRLTARTALVSKGVSAGNIYINRNQIGAVVGSQPFGGEGLSGTGPKAGGASYLRRLVKPLAQPKPSPLYQSLPGPSGERNELHLVPRLPVLCLGPGDRQAQAQATFVRALGGRAIADAQTEAVDKMEDPCSSLLNDDISCVLWWGDQETARAIAQTLAHRAGPIVPLICGYPDQMHVMAQRHVCTNTAALGGDAELLNAPQQPR